MTKTYTSKLLISTCKNKLSKESFSVSVLKSEFIFFKTEVTVSSKTYAEWINKNLLTSEKSLCRGWSDVNLLTSESKPSFSDKEW